MSLPHDVVLSYCWLEIIGINYFHCLKVLELLKVAEGDQKSLFGQYTSQRVKVMSRDVITSFDDNVFYRSGLRLSIFMKKRIAI